MKKRETIITDSAEFAALCHRLQQAPRIAFDTEFVPEYTYAPQLCLIQVATDTELAIIDPLALADVTPFWRLLADFAGQVVVHAGREELRFCRAAVAATPRDWFDVQLAAGFLGIPYPSSLTSLVQRLLTISLPSKETRTDWRHRPLSSRQLVYALDDVRHLLTMSDRIQAGLDKRGRATWFTEEMTAWLGDVLTPDTEPWERVTKRGGMSGRDLAVLRELAQWRDRRAAEMDKPTRWVLRDDLLVELAKRQPGDLAELKKSRGIGQAASGRWAEEILEAIRRGVDQGPVRREVVERRRETEDEQMIQKLLGAASIHLSRQHDVAAALLGTRADLVELLDWVMAGRPNEKLPQLMKGWRRAVCGEYLAELLGGKISLRVAVDQAEPRLVFDPTRAE